MTRDISVVGWTRSSIKVLTDSIRLTQDPWATGGVARCVILPSRPTTRLTRSISLASRLLISITSLIVLAIIPLSPAQSLGRRTEKSPFFNAVRRSEEHTSELQSLRHLVCRLMLGKKISD